MLTCVIYRRRSRRLATSGGGWRSWIAASQRLRSAVETRLFQTSSAAKTGGVYEPNSAVLPQPIDCDRITSNSGFRTSQEALLADHPIDEGGFPDVGPADDGQL